MITIKKASHKNADSIKNLWCEFMDFHERYDTVYKRAGKGADLFGQFVDKQISDRNALVLVAQINKEICGYLLARIEYRPPVFAERKHGVIYDVAVSGKFRRKGIGEKLYNESLEWFRKRKVTRVELTVATSNPVSMRFWTKLGLKTYSERRYLNINCDL